MTRTEDRLSELLHQATDGLSGGVSVEAVARRARRHCRLATSAAAVAVVALTAGAVAAGTALTGQHQAAAGNHRPARSPRERVAFEGVLFTLPAGWTTARPGCGWPTGNTVVINYQTGPTPYCPYLFPPSVLPTSVTLTTIYGPRYADGWTGQRITWHGQPAWLATVVDTPPPTARFSRDLGINGTVASRVDTQIARGVTTITLTLPWLNTAVSAEAPRPARAWALLRQLSAQPGSGLEAPRDASSVFIQSLAGRDGDGQRRNATITSAAGVRRLLADLRSLRPAQSPRPACDGSWWPDTALLTVHDRDGTARTYAAQFGACGQVIAGTGTAATASGHLLADIKRLVPGSGL